MPEFILDQGSPEAAREFSKLDAFTQGYIEAMFFTSTGPDDAEEDLEHASVAEFAHETWVELIKECRQFQDENALPIDQAISFFEYSSAQAGRDFWYTRNGHGCGFWDRDLLNEEIGNVGEKLTAAAHKWGNVDLYRGDDGLLYLS